MKSKKLFHRGLFFEGLRQLRLIGVLVSVILSLEAVLIPVGYMIGKLSDARYTKVITPTNLTGLSAHPLLVLLFIIVAPVMTLSLFSFLNKRNTSDFYHSIPHTRICLFVSFMAAIFTWLAVIAAGTTILSLFTILILSKFVLINVGSLLMLALNCLIGAFLVSAVIAIAMSITGTTFNNLILSGLILFLPRFVISLGGSAIINALPVLMENKLLFLFRSDCNIITGTVLGVLISFFGGSGNISDIAGILTSWESAIYTVILAALYLILGCVLFNHRKSEAAASAAPNRILQAAYRIALTMAFCSAICMMLFDNMLNHNYDFFFFFVMYIIALVIYFGYELITTKKWKNLLRAIPSLGIVLGLNSVFIASLWGIYTISLNYSPAADDIKSISIVSPNSVKNGSSYDFTEYVDLFNENVKITDKKLIGYVAECLKSNTNFLKEGKYEYINAYRNNISVDGKDQEPNYVLYYFKITTATGSRYRQIYVPYKYLEEFGAVLKENQSYKDAYMILPEALQITRYYNSMYESDSLTPDQLMEIYNTMRYEVAVSDFSKWYATVNNSYESSYVQMYVSAAVGMNNINVRINLYPEICPKAAALFAKYADAAMTRQIEEGKKVLQSALDNETCTVMISFYMVDMDGQNGFVRQCEYYINGMPSKDETIKTQTEYLLTLMSDTPTTAKTEDFIHCSIEIYDGKYGEYSRIYQLTCKINGDYPDELPDWLKGSEYSNLPAKDEIEYK